MSETLVSRGNCVKVLRIEFKRNKRRVHPWELPGNIQQLESDPKSMPYSEVAKMNILDLMVEAGHDRTRGCQDLDAMSGPSRLIVRTPLGEVAVDAK